MEFTIKDGQATTIVVREGYKIHLTVYKNELTGAEHFHGLGSLGEPGFHTLWEPMVADVCKFEIAFLKSELRKGFEVGDYYLKLVEVYAEKVRIQTKRCEKLRDLIGPEGRATGIELENLCHAQGVRSACEDILRKLKAGSDIKNVIQRIETALQTPRLKGDYPSYHELEVTAKWRHDAILQEYRECLKHIQTVSESLPNEA